MSEKRQANIGFALVATISSKSLGLKENKAIDVINLKFDKNQALIKKSYLLSAK